MMIRGAPKAKAKVRARPKVRAGILRRSARAGEAEERGEVDISEALKAGSEVATCAVPLQEWRTGLRLHLTEASYWESRRRSGDPQVQDEGHPVRRAGQMGRSPSRTTGRGSPLHGGLCEAGQGWPDTCRQGQS